MDKKERNRIASKKYRESSKGKAKRKAYNQENKAKMTEYSKNHYNQNKDRKQSLAKIWRNNNHNKETIIRWKQYGIITDDWENIYDIYMDTNNCNYCNKKFKNTLDRHLDHNHNITDSNNIRGILCRVCNTSDVLADSPTIF